MTIGSSNFEFDLRCDVMFDCDPCISTAPNLKLIVWGFENGEALGFR